jgi:hypothetical protein
LDEFLFLKENFDRQYLYRSLPHIPQSLDEFFIKLESILKNQPGEYPVFFPLATFARCYLKLLSENGSIQKLYLFVRDVSLVAFWKYRYEVKRKLPFEVKLFGTPHTSRIEEGNQS